MRLLLAILITSIFLYSCTSTVYQPKTEYAPILTPQKPAELRLIAGFQAFEIQPAILLNEKHIVFSSISVVPDSQDLSQFVAPKNYYFSTGYMRHFYRGQIDHIPYLSLGYGTTRSLNFSVPKFKYRIWAKQLNIKFGYNLRIKSGSKFSSITPFFDFNYATNFRFQQSLYEFGANGGDYANSKPFQLFYGIAGLQYSFHEFAGVQLSVGFKQALQFIKPTIEYSRTGITNPIFTNELNFHYSSEVFYLRAIIPFGFGSKARLPLASAFCL
ncbi:MAG: hypothetical protein ACPGLV_02505 [Bacteroidia bacterium]